MTGPRAHGSGCNDRLYTIGIENNQIWPKLKNKDNKKLHAYEHYKIMKDRN